MVLMQATVLPIPIPGKGIYLKDLRAAHARRHAPSCVASPDDFVIRPGPGTGRIPALPAPAGRGPMGLSGGDLSPYPLLVYEPSLGIGGPVRHKEVPGMGS